MKTCRSSGKRQRSKALRQRQRRHRQRLRNESGEVRSSEQDKGQKRENNPWGEINKNNHKKNAYLSGRKRRYGHKKRGMVGRGK